MPDLPLIALDEVDSTLAEAERRIEAGTSLPFLVTAAAQSGGRGRFGRSWQSPRGNLYWTLALARDSAWPVDHGLTFAGGLAVADVLVTAGIEPSRVALKWPNDALVDRKKIAGVLVKAGGGGPGVPAHVLVGIGLNISRYPENAAFPATSVKASGLDASIEASRDALTAAFLRRLAEWRSGGLPAIRDDYAARLDGVGRLARIAADRDRTHFIQGINRGIDMTGALRLEMESGRIEAVSAGDVLAV